MGLRLVKFARGALLGWLNKLGHNLLFTIPKCHVSSLVICFRQWCLSAAPQRRTAHQYQ
ncbi:Uncharacterised protein [Vibrio cholerae]|nr:Uncharacterised protein [Vibrio cholerae]